MKECEVNLWTVWFCNALRLFHFTFGITIAMKSWWNADESCCISLACQLALINSHHELTLIRVSVRLTSNICQASFLNSHPRLRNTLMQTLACQLSCNSSSRLTRTWELRKLLCKLSLLNVLNPHKLSSTLMKTLIQTLASQLSSTFILVWPGLERWENWSLTFIAIAISFYAIFYHYFSISCFSILTAVFTWKWFGFQW